MKQNTSSGTKTLYATDLDGTLLSDAATLSEVTRDHLKRIIDSGVAFTIATARAIQSTQPIFEGIPLPLPVVTFNGAFLSDLADGSHHLIHTITDDDVRTILDYLKSTGISTFVSTHDGREDHLYVPAVRNHGMEMYLASRRAAGDPRLTTEPGSDRYAEEMIISFTCIDQKETIESILKEVTSLDVSISTSFFENRYNPGWYWLTIRHEKANKGTMVRELMKRSGMDDFRMVSFGDETNDIDLLRQADRGIAVGNAAPGLKSVADAVIGTNHDDSVTRYILESENIV